MKRNRARQAARTPHPDPLTELQLQRIIGCQQAITRQERLISEYLEQMNSASDEQDLAGDAFRGSGHGDKIQVFEADMTAQKARIEVAAAGITTAEKFIADQRTEIAKLAAVMAASDLAYL